ncbi:MAG: LysR family transcriptional regulator [Gallionella sp.]
MARHLPPLNSLRVFEAAARHRSFIRAAEELHVTPTAASQQIKLLEDHPGVTLFKRGKTLVLNEAAAEA